MPGENVERERAGPAQRFALIALGVWALEEIVTSCLFALRDSLALLQRFPGVPVAGFLFSWVAPLVIAYRVERRGARSLGLVVRRRLRLRYALYAVGGLLLPALLLGAERALLVEMVEQVLYIGVAEELFSRGYLMTRLREWLGAWKGLVLSALLFGLAHVVSRLAQHGLRYPDRLALVFLQTFAGGLLLGYMALRAGSIVPGAIFHTSMNAYLPRLIAMLGR
jgi:membrane protease YdiL (CAAX protease family)